MNTFPKTTSTRFASIEEKLKKLNLKVFSSLEFSRIFGVGAGETKRFLESYTKRGLLVRLKKGLYALENDFPHEGVISNTLLRPSYLSFETALSHHGIIPETVYAITAATTKQPRSFKVRNLVYEFVKVKKAAYTGYFMEKTRHGQKYLIADPEKALADYLYLVSLGRRSMNDRLDLAGINKKKLEKYAKLYDRRNLISIIEKL